MSTTLNPEWQTLLEVIGLLDSNKIAYMLTGSLAKTFYSTPRMTRDIDIVVELNVEAIDLIFQAFKSSFYIDRAMVEEAVKHSAMFNVIHNQFHVKVDFIVRKNEVYRKTEFKRRKTFSLQGRAACVTAPEDLILSKLDWAKDSLSEMQISDVRDLLRSVKGLDMAYLKKWVDELGLHEIWGRVIK